MGRVLAPYGIRGWVRVRPYTESPDSLLEYPDWWLGAGDDWRELKGVEARVQGSHLVAKFPGVEDRGAAEKIAQQDVAVRREVMPEAGNNEYYWQDLVGLSVENAAGAIFGKVESLIETGANDVLVVNGQRRRLIPFAGGTVREVDLERGRIVVDWGEDW